MDTIGKLVVSKSCKFYLTGKNLEVKRFSCSTGCGRRYPRCIKEIWQYIFYQRIKEHKKTVVGKHVMEMHGLGTDSRSENFAVLRKCLNKFDCLIHEMLFIKQLKPRQLDYIAVTRSWLRVNLYAARGPRNQTGSFYTDCQRNVTTQTHVSLVYPTLLNHNSTLVITRTGSWVSWKQRSWCTKKSLAKTDSNTETQRFYLPWMT